MSEDGNDRLAAEIEHLDEHGYVVLKGVLAPDKVQALLALSLIHI